MNKYTVDVVSLDKHAESRQLKKYAIEDIDHIGVHENEPFEIHFKNNSLRKVQIRVSIDGTDILTGEPASTEPMGEMWMVSPYQTTKLKAWPESHNGGGRFLFTDTDKSVALNTHGDLSSKGVIAVAVFEEGYVPPYFTINNTRTSSGSSKDYDTDWYSNTNDTLSRRSFKSSSENKTLGLEKEKQAYFQGGGDQTLTKQSSRRSRIGGTLSSSSMPSDIDDAIPCCAEYEPDGVDYSRSIEINSTAAVGVGEYVDQHITKVPGLTEPVLATTLKLKYEWWTSLRSKLRKLGNISEPTDESGFPGDKKLNLGNTPRLTSTAAKPHKRRRYRRRKKHVEFERLV
jgi:hypothetical protein